MATMTAEQIEQKKLRLKQLSEEKNAIIKELQEAGAWPLDEADLRRMATRRSRPRPGGRRNTSI